MGVNIWGIWICRFGWRIYRFYQIQFYSVCLLFTFFSWHRKLLCGRPPDNFFSQKLLGVWNVPSQWPLTRIAISNTLRPRQNGRHFPGDIFKWIFFNENAWISINISLKFVPMGLIYNIPTLVQVMAWRRPGDKPLSEPMKVRLPTHMCVTRPQWVNWGRFMYTPSAYWTHWAIVTPNGDTELGQDWFR